MGLLSLIEVVDALEELCGESVWLGFYWVAWKTSLVKPALMWGDNSSIDSGASFFRWSMMVTSARFSCFVLSFLHQSALVFCCYALVLEDQEIRFLKCCGVWMVSLHGSLVRFSLVWLLVMFPLPGNSFLEKEKHYLRWLAHPVMFAKKIGSKLLDVQMFVTVRIMGAVPVSNMNFYKLLRSNTHVVLYPGLYAEPALGLSPSSTGFRPSNLSKYFRHIFLGVFVV
ncbi:hypothetical protein HID58_022645 [Brassica napus]|uniref:Uncharacterized protein n=1 Tax=Brassica napus TaxID=3708 RepID=A0ABQ8D0T1_BRANA|nr:hypothetical protein HID58_022645 [Brassica napus]